MDTDDGCRWTAPLAEAGGRITLARAGERAAARHLATTHGLVVLATNLRVAIDELRGELDVVAHDPRSGLLVVCEVKSRRRATGAGAVETLGARQQVRIRRMTAALLADGTLRGRSVRFDLVAVDATTHAADGTCRHLAGAW